MIVFDLNKAYIGCFPKQRPNKSVFPHESYVCTFLNSFFVDEVVFKSFELDKSMFCCFRRYLAAVSLNKSVEFYVFMTLHMIGLGLSDMKDISVRSLETVKKCSFVFLESYTSLLQCSVSDLEKFYGKSIIIAPRDMVEQQSDTILEHAADQDVAFLVVGDPMCATTHVDLAMRAKEKGIAVSVIHNASIVSAIGVIGLEVYKFGKITSIPFHHENVKTPLEVLSMNDKNKLHTLFLLDLDPISKKFLSIKDAAAYLIASGAPADSLAIGCARIGSSDQVIRAGSLKDISSFDYGNAPYCLVIPSSLHFMEEDALKQWRD